MWIREERGLYYRSGDIGGYIQKFPDWPPGARTANSRAICPYVQFYRDFVSQFSEFCRSNPLCCFSSRNTKGKRIFRYGPSPETFGSHKVSVCSFQRVGDWNSQWLGELLQRSLHSLWATRTHQRFELPVSVSNYLKSLRIPNQNRRPNLQTKIWKTN